MTRLNLKALPRDLAGQFTSGSWAKLLICRPHEIDELQERLSGLLSVRKLRGKHCPSSKDFFKEVGAALQLPWYFGENWDAFDECIQMDHVLGGFALAFQDAHLLLTEKKEEFMLLLKVLLDAREEWSQGIPVQQGGTGFPRYFGIVFQCEYEHAQAFKKRLDSVNFNFEELRILT